ncbi:testicular spindle-associated protein SHCBP1L-like [Protopterus annectens]|uniref:testicular spindle-associated protein SHCBP1L-like n=1 Tax=Protopterus annectens TaxID=7888 RepID=UPI001CFB46D0|nr:testicular spindle-associated protein SHCBP1L-like [Protopterus annectens]
MASEVTLVGENDGARALAADIQVEDPQDRENSEIASVSVSGLGSGKGAHSREVRRRLLPPNPEGDDTDESEDALPLPAFYVSETRFSEEERVELYCRQILAGYKAEEADEAMSKYLLEKLKTKDTWLGIWNTNPELFFASYKKELIPYVGILVQVTCKHEQTSYPLKATVSLAKRFSSNISNLPRELVEKVLEELDHCVPLLEIYPVKGQDSAVCTIAQSLEIASEQNTAFGAIVVLKELKRVGPRKLLTECQKPRILVLILHSIVARSVLAFGGPQQMSSWCKYHPITATPK